MWVVIVVLVVLAVVVALAVNRRRARVPYFADEGPRESERVADPHHGEVGGRGSGGVGGF